MTSRLLRPTIGGTTGMTGSSSFSSMSLVPLARGCISMLSWGEFSPPPTVTTVAMVPSTVADESGNTVKCSHNVNCAIKQANKEIL